MLVQSDNTEVKSGKSFKDVPETAWYYGAVSKAAALGLVNGDENGCFRPEDKITREDIACIIYRALGADGEYEASFTDKDDISGYAENAVFAMKALGIVSGYPDGSFLPKQHAARAEAAAFVYRYMNYKSDRSVE